MPGAGLVDIDLDRVQLGPLATYVRDRQIPLELAPTCNVQIGAVPSTRSPSGRAVPPLGHASDDQHGQPAHERGERRRPRCSTLRRSIASGGVTSKQCRSPASSRRSARSTSAGASSTTSSVRRTRSSTVRAQECDDGSDRQAAKALRARRRARHRGVRRPAACKELIERSREMLEDFEPESISVFTTHEQTRTSDDYFLDSGDKVRFFFEEDAFLPDGSLKQAKELSINKLGHALHDLDPVFSSFSRTADLAGGRGGRGVRRPEAAAVDVHLQAAEHRRRGDLPPGQHVPLHRPDDVRRLLVRTRGRHARERLPVGRAGRAPRAAAQAVQACVGRRHEFETLERCAAARARRRTARAARDSGGHAGAAARAASPLQRAEPFAEVAARVLGAPDRGRRLRIPTTTGCNAATTCRSGGSREPADARLPRASAQGAVARPPRRRGAPGDGGRARRCVRLHGSADEGRRRARAVVRLGREPEGSRAVPRRLRPHPRRDADTRGVDAGRVGVRGGLGG